MAEAETRLAAEADGLRAKRSGITRDIDPDALKAYERLLARYGRRALSCADGSNCRVCGMRVTVQDIQLIKQQGEDDVISCKSCGRMLYLLEEKAEA